MYTSVFNCNRKLEDLSLEKIYHILVLYTSQAHAYHHSSPPFCSIGTNTAFEGESMVCCGTPLASLLAGLLGSLARRGRVAGVAIATIVVLRTIIIMIVVATVAAKVVMRYNRESSSGQSPRTCCCSGSCYFHSR